MDVSMKEGRAELRALLARASPAPWFEDERSISGGDGCAVIVASDMAHEDGADGAMLAATSTLITKLRNNATAILDALDRAEATIARLTAEVTDLEAYQAWKAAQPEIPPGLGCPVSSFLVALTSFLEARKAGNVERTEGGNG